MRKLGLMICLAIILTFLGKNVFAIELFEGRLHDIKGSVQQTLNYRTHQDVRSVKFSSFRTTLRIEGLLDCIKEPTWNVQLYGLFNYWYDNGTNIDQDLKDAIRLESGGDGGSFGLGAYKKPNTQVQIMKELYFEVAVGEYFKARLGKQMVSWGETAESRVADVINPLDYNNFVAFPDWEDYKIGLWMGRFFYAPPNMWQDISFELIVIPPDFQYNRYPPAGSGLFFGTYRSSALWYFVLARLYGKIFKQAEARCTDQRREQYRGWRKAQGQYLGYRLDTFNLLHQARFTHFRWGKGCC
jgi:hypothetical protein